MADWEGDSYHGGSTGRRSANEQLDLLRSLQLTALGACALLATVALVTLGFHTWRPHFPAQGGASLGLMVAVLFGLPILLYVKDNHPWSPLFWFTLFWFTHVVATLWTRGGRTLDDDSATAADGLGVKSPLPDWGQEDDSVPFLCVMLLVAATLA